jgi:predicted DNA-binding antitoxin AbrB/MazE fold protein
MSRTITVVYDGEVLRPERPLDLEMNARYIVTVTERLLPEQRGNVWDVLDSLAGTVDCPSDWAGAHDHYLYGTPRRQELECE